MEQYTHIPNIQMWGCMSMLCHVRHMYHLYSAYLYWNESASSFVLVQLWVSKQSLKKCQKQMIHSCSSLKYQRKNIWIPIRPTCFLLAGRRGFKFHPCQQQHTITVTVTFYFMLKGQLFISPKILNLLGRVQLQPARCPPSCNCQT